MGKHSPACFDVEITQLILKSLQEDPVKITFYKDFLTISTGNLHCIEVIWMSPKLHLTILQNKVDGFDTKYICICYK